MCELQRSGERFARRASAAAATYRSAEIGERAGELDRRGSPVERCGRFLEQRNRGFAFGGERENALRGADRRRDLRSACDGKVRTIHPVRWHDGRIEDLGLPPGASSGFAFGVNDEGDVSGHGVHDTSSG